MNDSSASGVTGDMPGGDTRKSFLAGLVGMKIASRYEVVRVLGEGGMGVVAEARHIELEQRVAIKFMFPEFLSNEVLSARFAREAKLAAKVQSPHIVRVNDVGRLESGVPYLVMDLLSGHDLGAELDEKGVLPVDRAVDYILQACAGIGALHAIGAIHRDLKPSNLFIADVAGVKTVMVLDFGISKDVTTTATTLTNTEAQLGTPMYMSPEQIRASKNVDVRSDIWSLGVILYELLTGTLPFERSGNSIGELFAVILMTDPIPLCMRRPELPPALEEVVMRCLRRGSWDRYESVAALAEALRPFARPTSMHRIDSVRRALGAGEVSSEAPQTRGDEPTVSASTSDHGAVPKGTGPAAVVTRPAPGEPLPPPSASLELEVDYSGRAAPRVERPRSAQASPSLASSTRSVPLPGDSRGISRSVFAIVCASTLFLGAAVGLALYATSTHGTSEAPSMGSSPPELPTATAAAPPPPEHDEPIAEPVPVAASATHAPARAAQPAKPAAPARSATGRAATTPHAPTTDELIDSRK